MYFGNRLIINMIQHIMQKPFLSFGNILNDQCDIGHYAGTILVVHVVNSSIVYVHILTYHTLVLYFYMYLSEMTFQTNSSPIILITKILSYLIFCNGNACYQQCMFHRFSFLCSVLQIVVCPFILCAIVLPVLLRITDLATSNSYFKYIVYMFTIIPQKIKIK